MVLMIRLIGSKEVPMNPGPSDNPEQDTEALELSLEELEQVSGGVRRVEHVPPKAAYPTPCPLTPRATPKQAVAYPTPCPLAPKADAKHGAMVPSVDPKEPRS